MIRVKSVLGLGNIPTDRTSATKWLLRNGVSISSGKGQGGTFEYMEIADLPTPERQAYLARCAADTGLPMGVYDEGAHEAFWAAPASMRQEAERKAAMACLLVSIRAYAGWPDRIALVQERFGVKGTSKPSLKRLLRDVQDVDPINYAPTLLADYRGPQNKAVVTDETWSLFMTIIRDAAPEFPIIQAWRDVRDIADKRGWD